MKGEDSETETEEKKKTIRKEQKKKKKTITKPNIEKIGEAVFFSFFFLFYLSIRPGVFFLHLSPFSYVLYLIQRFLHFF